MNTVWYPPDQIDWLDGLNPLRRRARRNSRYVLAALQSPAMVELRAAAEAGTHRLNLIAAPDDTFLTIPAGTTYVMLPGMKAGAWVFGVSGFSTQPEGFLGNVTPPSGTPLFAKPFNSQNLGATPLFCPGPLGLPSGGPVQMRIQNLSINPNLCQLVLWVLEPIA